MAIVLGRCKSVGEVNRIAGLIWATQKNPRPSPTPWESWDRQGGFRTQDFLKDGWLQVLGGVYRAIYHGTPVTFPSAASPTPSCCKNVYSVPRR